MPVIQRPFVLWAGEVFRLLTGFCVLRQLVRAVPAETMGVYLSIVALVMVLPRVLDAGVPQALAYFLRAHVVTRRSLLPLLAFHALVCLLLAFVLALFMRLFPFNDSSVHELAFHHWLTIAFLVASESAALLAVSTLIPRNRYFAHVLATTTPSLLMLISLTFCLVVGLHPTASDLLKMLLGASLLGAIFAWAGAIFTLPVGNHRVDLLGRELYRYGIRSYGSGLSKVMSQRFDRLYLATAIGSIGYSQYSLAVSIRDLAVFPANLHALTIRNRQMDLLAVQSDLLGARRLLWGVSFGWLATYAACTTLAWPLFPRIVQFIFGQAQDEIAEISALLMLSVGPMAVLGFAWNHMYALGWPERVTLLNFIGLAQLVPLFAFIMARAGATQGAAIAAVVWSVLTAASSLGWALLSHPRKAQ